MKISKALDYLHDTARNLTSARGDFGTEQADIRLENASPRSRTDCQVSRLPDWSEDVVYDLSVIIAAYNAEKYICTSLESVLNQASSYCFEVIVVDDGSADNTPQLLKQYESLPNVRILRQENNGAAAARNTGISVSRGRFLQFHDADDQLMPGAIQKMLSCADCHGADVVIGGYRCEREDGSCFPGESYSEKKIENVYSIPGLIGGKIYHRSLFANLAFPMGYWFEDSIVTQIVLPKAACVYTVDGEVFSYLQNEQGASALSRANPKSLDSLYITEFLLEERQKFGLTIDQDEYQYFLDMVLLTYHRTRKLSEDVLYAVFLKQQQLLLQYFPDCSCSPNYRLLEHALKHSLYHRYLWCCELLWIGGRFGK